MPHHSHYRLLCLFSCTLPILFRNTVLRELHGAVLTWIRILVQNLLINLSKLIITSKLKIFRFKKREYRDGIKRKETRQG